MQPWISNAVGMVLEARGTEHKSRVQIPFSRRIFQPEKFYEI